MPEQTSGVGRPRSLDHDQVTCAIEWHDEGVRTTRIAKRLNVSVWTVRRALRREGVIA